MAAGSSLALTEQPGEVVYIILTGADRLRETNELVDQMVKEVSAVSGIRQNEEQE